MLVRNGVNCVSGMQSVSTRSFYGAWYRWARFGGGCSAAVKHQQRAISRYGKHPEQMLNVFDKKDTFQTHLNSKQTWGGKGIPPRKDRQSTQPEGDPETVETRKESGVKVWAAIDGKSRDIPTKTDIELAREEEARAIRKRMSENAIKAWKTTIEKDRVIRVSSTRGIGDMTEEKGHGSEAQGTTNDHGEEENVTREAAAQAVTTNADSTIQLGKSDTTANGVDADKYFATSTSKVDHKPAESLESSIPPPESPNRLSEPESVVEKSSPSLPELATSVRDLMRAVPHSVVVLTTTTKPFLGDEAFVENTDLLRSKDMVSVSDFRGMTLSSFTTVTLTPEPTITFNIKEPSQTLDSLKKSPHFLIHILHQGSVGIEIAEAFTKGNGEGDELGHVFNTRTGTYRVKRGHSHPRVCLPQLYVKNGIIRALRCEVLSENDRAADGGSGFIKVGDHTIVLARVHEICGKSMKLIKEAKLPSLCYQHGDFVTTLPHEKPGGPRGKPSYNMKHLKLNDNGNRDVHSNEDHKKKFRMRRVKSAGPPISDWFLEHRKRQLSGASERVVLIHPLDGQDEEFIKSRIPSARPLARSRTSE